MDVSIIIVNYNTKDLTRNCLKSVFEQTKDIDFEVIVSDNGSTDGSIEMIKTEFPKVILIENNANLGFGAANNRGLAIAKGKYVFYLNSDTLLLNNAVKIFYDFWENADNKDEIGALGCNLLDEKGNYIHSFGVFPRPLKLIKDLFRRYLAMTYKSLWNKKRNFEISKKCFFYVGDVDYITGADLFMKRNSLAKFDERYFMYAEEVDLQYKLKNERLKRCIIKEPCIIHLEGGSDKNKSLSLRQQYSSFSKIYMDISNLKFIKYNISFIWTIVLKFFVYICWHHPLVYQNTKNYIKELRRI